MSLGEVIAAISSGVFAVLWYLLRQKDAKQQKEMEDMKKQHEKEITKLELDYKNELTQVWKIIHETEKETQRLHNEDARDLQNLRVQIAERHYDKGELDNRFEKVERTLNMGFAKVDDNFTRVTDSLDRLNAVLINRIQFEGGNKT